MGDRVKGALVILILAFGTASCSSTDFPKRGFLTRYFAGSYLQDSVSTTNDFVGRPLHPAIDSYTGSAPSPIARNSAGSAPMSSSMARTLRTCELTAHQRASDVAYQGLGEATQKAVFDNAYADCMSWRTSH